jgi:two-component system NtrC family sensor kinase
MSEADSYRLAYEREKKARQLAEKLLEDKTRELYENVLHLEGVVAELKTAQSQLVHSEKMASLGQLAAGIAHEINNPLGFSYSNLSSLKDYLSDIFKLDELVTTETELGNVPAQLLQRYSQLKQQIQADFIKQDTLLLLGDTLEGLSRVKNIVANLKKISYKGRDEFIDCNINECIEDCLKVVGSELKYTMKVVLDLQNCPYIKGQASDLNQVFINLFINAKQACLKKGTLTIRSFQDKEMVVVSIEDNGKGIAADNLKNIFDPFYTTKAVGEGTGLGLSISHGIIEKHGGNIVVASKENEGTCFTISFPTER